MNIAAKEHLIALETRESTQFGILPVKNSDYLQNYGKTTRITPKANGKVSGE